MKLQCPNCDVTGQIPDEYLGKKLRCPRCDFYFTPDVKSIEDFSEPEPIKEEIAELETAESVTEPVEEKITVAESVKTETKKVPELISLVGDFAPDWRESGYRYQGNNNCSSSS